MVKTTTADYIVILTPNDLHFEMATTAANAGKIVLSEKPLAIKSQHIHELAKKPNIFTTLQLHYHPTTKKLKKEINPNEHYEIEMDISVHRDEQYYNSWKGQPERSGGVLVNLGVHYFDILIHFFGEPTEAVLTHLDEKTGNGNITGKNYTCKFMISTDEARDKQRRIFKINGANYNFSSKENLSHENLHRKVYNDLMRGKGVTPQMVLSSIELIEELHKSV